MADSKHAKESMDLTINVREGEVLKAETWSETHVSSSSSGGGGYIGPQGGQVNAPKVTIHSTTVENLRIFVRYDDGPEDDLKLKDWTFGFREGNRVRIAYEDGILAGIRNVSSEKTRVPFSTSKLKSLRKRNMVPKKKHARVALLGTVLAFLLSALAYDLNNFGPISNLRNHELLSFLNAPQTVGVLDLYAELGFVGGFALLAVPFTIAGVFAANGRLIKRNNLIERRYKEAVQASLNA